MAAVTTLVTPRWILQTGHIKQSGAVLFFNAWSHIYIVISPHSKVFIWRYETAVTQQLLWTTHSKGAIKTKDRQANTHRDSHTHTHWDQRFAKELTAIRGSEIGSGYFQQLPDSLGDLEAKPLSRSFWRGLWERKGGNGRLSSSGFKGRSQWLSWLMISLNTMFVEQIQLERTFCRGGFYFAAVLLKCC